MEYKLLEKQDVELMKYFVDDDNTKYDEVILNTFLEEKNTFGYIAKENDIIVGFAFGYVLVKPNGIKDFYQIVNKLKTEYDMSIILVSHDLDLAKQYADKIILLDKEVIKEGTPDEVFNSLEFKNRFGEL